MEKYARFLYISVNVFCATPLYFFKVLAIEQPAAFPPVLQVHLSCAQRSCKGLPGAKHMDQTKRMEWCCQLTLDLLKKPKIVFLVVFPEENKVVPKGPFSKACKAWKKKKKNKKKKQATHLEVCSHIDNVVLK